MKQKDVDFIQVSPSLFLKIIFSHHNSLNMDSYRYALVAVKFRNISTYHAMGKFSRRQTDDSFPIFHRK